MPFEMHKCALKANMKMALPSCLIPAVILSTILTRLCMDHQLLSTFSDSEKCILMIMALLSVNTVQPSLCTST